MRQKEKQKIQNESTFCVCVCVLVAGFVWYMKWAADILKMFEWDERGGEKGSMKIYDGYNEVGLCGILRGFCSRRWPIDILKCRHVFFIHSLCVASFSFRLLWMNQIESCYFSLQFHFGAAADICLWCCSVLDRCSCFFFVFFKFHLISFTSSIHQDTRHFYKACRISATDTCIFIVYIHFRTTRKKEKKKKKVE